jgi:ABC-2 type transport system ATP-binding protein
MTDHLLDIRGVIKRYNGTTAVDGISLVVPSGSIFGLLGPNGAGKTSLIRMITQITMPDSGSIFLHGRALREEDTSRMGYMPEERGLYKQMKIGEHLIYLGELRGLSRKDATHRVREWFEKFDIAGWWNKKVDQLSKGMQQKVQFIATVLHDPELLILDEPFSGLDPINAELITQEIFRMKTSGKTVIFSTHRMEQVEQICDSIALIHHGRIILDGDVASLKHRFKKNLYHVTFDGALPVLPDPWSAVETGDGSATIHATDVSPNTVLRFLIQHVEVHGFTEVLPTLHEIFIDVVTESGHA